MVSAIARVYKIRDESIVKYKEALDEFCKETLRKFNNIPMKYFATAHLNCEKITIGLNWSIEDHSFQDIVDLLQKAFDLLYENVDVIKIQEIKSITVTCYAPHYLMEHLLETGKRNLDQLKDMGLTSLTIGYYTVYDEFKTKQVNIINYIKYFKYLKEIEPMTSNHMEISKVKLQMTTQEERMTLKGFEEVLMSIMEGARIFTYITYMCSILIGSINEQNLHIFKRNQ